MRILGLIMMVAGFTICGVMYYVIDVGGYPANRALTCGFWGILGVAGLIIFATHPAKGNKTSEVQRPPTLNGEPTINPAGHPEWVRERAEIVEALHSKDEVDKAWALDLLSKYARMGVEEAKQLLREHLPAG